MDTDYLREGLRLCLERGNTQEITKFLEENYYSKGAPYLPFRIIMPQIDKFPLLIESFLGIDTKKYDKGASARIWINLRDLFSVVVKLNKFNNTYEEYWLRTHEKFLNENEKVGKKSVDTQFKYFFDGNLEAAIFIDDIEAIRFFSKTIKPGRYGAEHARLAVVTYKNKSLKELLNWIEPKVNHSSLLSLACSAENIEAVKMLIPITTPKKDNSKCLMSVISNLIGSQASETILKLLLPHTDADMFALTYPEKEYIERLAPHLKEKTIRRLLQNNPELSDIPHIKEYIIKREIGKLELVKNNDKKMKI